MCPSPPRAVQSVFPVQYVYVLFPLCGSWRFRREIVAHPGHALDVLHGGDHLLQSDAYKEKDMSLGLDAFFTHNLRLHGNVTAGHGGYTGHEVISDERADANAARPGHAKRRRLCVAATTTVTHAAKRCNALHHETYEQNDGHLTELLCELVL